MFRVRYHRPNKYHAIKTACRDHWHPSKLEAKVCGELEFRKRAGDIKDYDRQKRMRLEIDGCYIGTCIPDFYVYHNDGTTEFVEAKGMELAKWKKDWRILQHMYKDDPTVKFSVIKR